MGLAPAQESFTVDMLEIRPIAEVSELDVFMVSTKQAHVGPGLHKHLVIEERFFPILGDFEFLCYGHCQVASPGATIVAPPGAVHQWKTHGKGPWQLLIVATPGGYQLSYLRELSQLSKTEVAWWTIAKQMARDFDLVILD